MDTKSFMNFESAIDMVADIYFFGGFVSGAAVCVLVVSFILFLNR